MTTNKKRFLLDVNVLIALVDQDHVHHSAAVRWFNASGKHNWGTCAFTEAGFLRVMTGPKTGSWPLAKMTRLLERLADHPGYHYWPISTSWATLSAPFAARLYGHQQITDAFLLGMAVKEHGVLVTLDQALRHLAGADHRGNLLVLE
jgi:uncharacterized protein